MRVIRKLWPIESFRLADHLLRLDAVDRAHRFSGAVGADFVAAHCRSVKWPDALVVGCFEDGVMRGAVELHFDRTAPPRSELALTVERGWQGRGIGTALFGRAVQIASNRGVSRLRMLCLADNRRMQRIAVGAGCRIQLDSGQVYAELPVPPATPWSLIGEGMEIWRFV